jgi:hypothetical protein
MIAERHSYVQRYGAAGGRISTAVSCFMRGPTVSQLSTLEELALARQQLSDVVIAYEAATTQAMDAGDNALLLKSIGSLQPLVREALDTVRRMAKTAADIESSMRVQPAMVAALAQTLQSTVVRLCGHDPALLDEIEHELSTVFHMLSTTEGPEILSPAETVAQIDALIPKAEGEYVETIQATAGPEEVAPTFKTLAELEAM